MKNVVKKVNETVEANAVDDAQDAMKQAVSTIQKTASRGVIHKKKAARKISRLARKVNKLSAS
jgi:small subunit ribosomal protein S20